MKMSLNARGITLGRVIVIGASAGARPAVRASRTPPTAALNAR